MGLAATVADALGVNPTAASGFPVESPDDRRAALGRQVAALRGPNEPANDPGNEKLARRAEARIASSDPFNDGTQGHPVQPQSNSSPFGGLAATVEGALGAPAEAPKAASKPSSDSPTSIISPLDVVKGAGNIVSGLGASIVGGWRGLAALASGAGLEGAAQATTEAQQAGTYQPEGAGAEKVTAAIASPANPMNWVGAFGKKAGEVANELGAGPGLSTAIETVINAAPLLLLRGGKAGAAVPAGKTLTEAAPVSLPANVDVPTVLRQRLAAQQAQTAAIPISEVGKAVEAAQVPATAHTARPALPVAVQAPAKPVEAPKPVNLAAVVDEEPVKGGLPPTVQPERQGVLARIGLQTVRNSAIEGDALRAATDFQVGKFTGEAAGKAAAEQFASENAALKNHAANIVKETGGTPGMDLDALEARGRNIAAPLDALKEFFQKTTKALYAEADKRSGGVASVQPEGFGKLLNTESVFAGKAPNQSLGSGVRSYLKEQGIMDKDGALRPITATEAEGIKQYINSQYSHETSGLAGKIKGALDKDVFKSAGEDVYSAARAMYRKQKQTLDNPNGVSKVMDFDPQNPMNRATAFEKIPDTVANLSKAQYDHLLQTLREMPKEIQLQAQQAIREIQAHWGEKLIKKGTGLTPDAQWNSPRVTEAIKLNSGKIDNAFKDSPSLMAKIEDLQKAGNILRVNAAYPGAAAQAANAVKRGVMSNILRPIGASTGGTVGAIFGPAGAAAGAMAGDLAGARAAQSLGERGALKKWQKGTTSLKDIGASP